MNIIGTVSFDFKMEDEIFAQKLYGLWDTFFASSFESIANEVLSKYDIEDQQIEIPKIELDLGNLLENEFYEKFPLLVREKLEASLNRLFYSAQQDQITYKQKQDSDLYVLFQFLLYGRLSWSLSVKTNIADLFIQIMKTNKNALKLFLQKYGHYSSLQARLIYQLNDKELEQGVALLAASQSGFICSYVRFLKMKYRKLPVLKTSVGEYSNLVWHFVYAYLLNSRGSYFNKKSLLVYTLLKLANKYRLTYSYLLDIITRDLDLFAPGYNSGSELFHLMQELKKEMRDSNHGNFSSNIAKIYKIIAQSIKGDSGHEIPKAVYISLINMLSRPDSCRVFIRGMKEEEIIQLIPIIHPSQSRFIIRYAHLLDSQKEKGSLEAKIGGEFRLLKWQIIFPLILDNKGPSFNRKQFVFGVLNQIAAHYNLILIKLIAFFLQEELLLNIDVQLKNILQILFIEQSREGETRIEKSIAKITLEQLLALIQKQEIWTKNEQKQITRAFQNKELRQIVITRLNDKQLRKLSALMFLEQSPFICAYAESLNYQKDYGIFQGRLGGEFSALKWIFIFNVLSEDDQNVFNKHYFVANVLRKIGAKYNLSYFELLETFRNDRRNPNLPFALDQILEELYEEELKQVISQLLMSSNEAHKLSYIARFIPKQKGFILNYIKLLSSQKRNPYLLLKLGSDFQELKWQFLFSVLLKMPNSSFNRRYFVSKTLEGIAAHYNLKIIDLIIFFKNELETLEISSQFNLSIILDDLLDEHQTPQRKNLKRQDSQKKALQIDPQALFKNADVEAEPIFVNNAGLVLLAPFIPRLFESCALLVNGEFKDEQAQHLAVFLLQYAVFGKTEFYESELFLNKLLLAYNIENPIPYSLELSQDQQDRVLSLLNAVLHHWGKLGGTSIEGLRESFLQREGCLLEKEDFWDLSIEAKSFDMLLDSLSWNYTIIKFKWMEKAIHVKWRNN